MYIPNEFGCFFSTQTGNRPPDIHGPSVIHVQSGVDFTESFNAYDPDGDDVAVFSLQVSYININD